MAKPLEGGGCIVVGTIFASFAVTTAPSLDVEALAGVLWDVELQRDSAMRATAIAMRLRGVVESARTRGKVDRATFEGVSHGNPPASATIYTSGKVTLVTSQSTDAAQQHAQFIAAAVKRGLTCINASANAIQCVGVHRFAIDGVNCFFHTFSEVTTDGVTEPRSRPNALHLQLVHSRLAGLSTQHGRVDVLSDPHERSVKAEVTVNLVDSGLRTFRVRIEHTGVVTTQRVVSVSDFAYVCQHVLGPVLRQSTRSVGTSSASKPS
jgi:hypothetical protein